LGPAQHVADANAAAVLLAHLEDSAWVVAAFMHLVSSGALSEAGFSARSAEDDVAAQALAAAGLMVEGPAGVQPAVGLAALLSDESLGARLEGTASSLRQLAMAAGIMPEQDGKGWATQDDATLLAQGRSSAFGGRMLATIGVASLTGLSERFRGGGQFLDVGVGVGELAAAFCAVQLDARVLGIDVLPRALELARRTIEQRALQDRLEVRLQPVQELDDVERFDLAWMPAIFIPEAVFATGAAHVRVALRPGGWLVVGAARFDRDPMGAAVARWRTIRAGGTAMTTDETRTVLEGEGFVEFMSVPSPPTAPALYAVRRPLS
jgi:precorrin-6B methylase 2